MNVVLVGNPNVGKSVIFNLLTGKYVTVSNYPGTTVEVSKGAGWSGTKNMFIVDTPGVNSLTAHSEDERVTKNILSGSDIGAIVQVIDSKNLKRSLLFTLELVNLKIPLVLVLNMSDEARERGIGINVKKLSECFGVDVISTIAVTGDGIGNLKEAILKAKIPGIKCDLTREGDHLHALKARSRLADSIACGVMTFSPVLKKNLSEKIGNFFTMPLTGIPVLIGILVFMYYFVGKFAAGICVDFISRDVFDKLVNPFFEGLFTRFVPIPFIRDMFIGEYGILKMALNYAFAIILPIVTAFFIFFGFLEDSGYLPRLSVLSDRIFKKMGLNGRAILPMVLGLGCGTMAMLTTRILDTKKERLLASILLMLAIPCSAQLGIILGILGSISLKALLIWMAIMFFVIVFIGTCASKIIPGERSHFIQELPPIRMPQINNILFKTMWRLKWYIKEAVPLFILGTVLLFFLDKAGALLFIDRIFKPVVSGFLGLPGPASEVFIVGFLRRDYGAAGFYDLFHKGLLDNIQVMTGLVVITLFIPCIAQFFVAVKERGARTALFIGAFVMVFAIFAGGLVNFTLRYFLAHGIKVI